MVNLLDLIQVYENSLDFDLCDSLKTGFDNVSSLHESVINDENQYIDFNLTENLDSYTSFEDNHNTLIKKTFEYRNKYYEYVDDRVFPKEHQFEHYHILKYSEGDYSDTKVDVDNYDDARRFLCFMWFLNTNKNGYIEFQDFDITLEKGKLIVFPSLWTFPYKIKKLIDGENYILTTYLHYK